MIPVRPATPGSRHGPSRRSTTESDAQRSFSRSLSVGAAMAHSGRMTVVTQLLVAVGTLTAVVLLLLMAATPLLLELPLRRRHR